LQLFGSLLLLLELLCTLPYTFSFQVERQLDYGMLSSIKKRSFACANDLFLCFYDLSEFFRNSSNFVDCMFNNSLREYFVTTILNTSWIVVFTHVRIHQLKCRII